MSINYSESTVPEQLPLSPLCCPKCGAEAGFAPGVPVEVQNRGTIGVQATCPDCSHTWMVELQPVSKGGSLTYSGQRTLTSAPSSAPIALPPDPFTGSNLTKPEKWFYKEAKVAVIPLPVFWGAIILLIVLVGIGGWLFGELQRQKTEDAISEAEEAALLLLQATEAAVIRATGTQQAVNAAATGTAEARLAVAASSTAAQAATSAAATVTTEVRATGTAEWVATSSAESTATAERSATATAESIGTAEARASATAEHRATATAEKAAAISVQSTATTQRRATATAESATATAEARTPVPAPELNMLIFACDTSFNVSSWLGEVKNAWVTVENIGNANAHHVKVVLSANDEEVPHPNQKVEIPVIPPDHQITYKLTVDSSAWSGSVITATVTSDETEAISFSKGQCDLLDETAKALINEAGDLGVLILRRAVLRR